MYVNTCGKHIFIGQLSLMEEMMSERDEEMKKLKGTECSLFYYQVLTKFSFESYLVR